MENNFKYIVYQTININNNKIYVGVHKTKDPSIFDGYIGNGVNIYHPSTYVKPKYPFQYAVKKYGTSSFRRSVLYIFDNDKMAYNKEAEIVNEEFIKRSDTYNVILSGKIHPTYYIRSCIYQFDLQGNLVKKWNDIYDVSEFLCTWKESVYSAIRHKSRLYNFYWSYSDSINLSEYSSPNESRKVYQYNKDGKCIAIYNTIGEAARYNNVQPGHIITYIKAGTFSKGEYFYSYELYDEYVSKPRLDLKGKTLYLYDLDGNFIKSEFIVDFKREFDIHTYKEISNIILNKSSLKGFQIRLEYTETIEKYSPKNKKRAVEVYTIDGSLVGEFESVTLACKTLKLDSSTVSKILRGVAKTTKGYTIKYKN